MKKILFLHGFFATGSWPMARALKEAFEGTAVVLTPDLPLHPKGSSLEIGKRILVDVDRENGISIYVVQIAAIVESHVTDTLQCV